MGHAAADVSLDALLAPRYRFSSRNEVSLEESIQAASKACGFRARY